MSKQLLLNIKEMVLHKWFVRPLCVMLGIVITVALEDSIQKIMGKLKPPPPKVIIVGPGNLSGSQAYLDFLKGIEKARLEYKDDIRALGIDIEYQSDSNKPEISKQLAEKIVKDDGVLSVIYAANSTIASEAIPVYREANFPVFLAYSTMTSLLGDEGMGGKYSNIFRLPANDSLQVDAIYKIIRHNIITNNTNEDGTKSVAIIKENQVTNSQYSNYISKELRSRLELCKKDRNYHCPEVIFDDSIRNGAFFTQEMRDLKIDFIVYIGSQKDAQILKRQAKRFGIDDLLVILTDSGISSIPYEGFSFIEGAYGVFPHNSIESRTELTKPNPSYWEFGHDAISLMLSIAGRDGESTLKGSEFLKVLQSSNFNHKGVASSYSFDHIGENICGGFGLWYVEDSRKGWTPIELEESQKDTCSR